MTYKAVFLDIDGTILNSKHQIPQSTKEAIRLLKEKEIEVFIATGRSNFETSEISNHLGIDSIVSSNGLYVIYKGIEVYKRPFNKVEVTKLIKEVNKYKNAVSCHSADSIYYSDFNNPIVKEVRGEFDFANHKIKTTMEEIEDVYKMALYTSAPDELKRYESVFKNLKFVRWNADLYCYDVMPTNTSKVTGIQEALKYLNIKKDDAVAFGDGLNDIEMLSYVGLGVAMGNSHPNLLPYADYQTKHVNEDGILYGLKKLGII